MIRFRFAMAAAVCALTGWLAGPVQAQTATPTQTPGVEVLARGPVHEAFAEVADLQAKPPPAVPKQPPAPIEELPPEQKPEGDNVQWIPGYWAWDQDLNDFIWVSGVWRNLPPDRQRVPGHWQQVEGGWQWVPGVWLPLKQNEVQVLPPPPAPLDEGPSSPAPNDNSIYVPGTWVFVESRYMWRPGFWIANQPDWVWTPAHYAWAPGGAIFVEGFWDYPLENRGLLFAPVRIDRRVLTAANWTYVPQYVVRTQNLLGSMFVRAGSPHYYFGDYFGNRYAQAGFVPWTEARINRHAPDYLYSYYRHRPEAARWEREIRDVYTARQQGRELPPRTLVQQNQVIQDIRRGGAVNNTTLNRMTVVRPLAQAEPGLRMQALPRDQHLQVRQSAQWYRQVQQQRTAHHDALVRTPTPAARPPTPAGQPPAPAARPPAFRLPQAPNAAPRAPVRTPAAPAMPKHVERPR